MSKPPSLHPMRDDLAVDGVVRAPEPTKAPDEGRGGYDGTDRMYHRLADWYNGAPESMVLRAALGALPMTPRALEAWPGFIVVTKAFLDSNPGHTTTETTAAAVLSHMPWRPRSEAQKRNDAVQAERIKCLAANAASVVSDAPTDRDFDEVEFRHFLDQPDTIEEEESPYTATADHVAVAVAYAHALCGGAVADGWRRGACDHRALTEDFEDEEAHESNNPSHPYLALAFIGGVAFGYGRKNETFLLVTSFRLAHETALETVAAYFSDRAQKPCVCKVGEAEDVSRVLVRECRDELKKANDVRFAIDSALRKRMRTLFVAQTILSIQRDAVCSLSKRGLVSTREKEVLLEEVHEDLEAVFKLEEDRVSHHGEHDGVEHWVDPHHALPSRDFAAHFSAQPPEDGACPGLSDSRMFGASGMYATARQRVGDTRRVLGLRNSGDAAEWCGAHISDTRRRMDQASAPASRDSTDETSN